MSNPFDQFSGQLQAALPPQQPSDGSVAFTVASNGQQQQQQQPPQPQQFSLMAQPQEEKKPVMNAMMQPGMQQQGMYGQQPPQQQGQMVGMYGQQPPPQQQPGMGGMYGQQPPQQPPQQQGQMVGMYGQQPPPQQQGMGGMMAPTQSMVGAGFGGGSANGGMNGSMTQLGAPPPNAMAGALVPSQVQSNPYALGPPAGAANPFGAPAPALGAPPAPQQIAQQNANPFGAPAPQLQAQPSSNALVGAPPAQMGGPFGGPPAPQANALAMDPFAAPAPPQLQAPPAPQLAADPWGAQPVQPPVQSHALVPSAAPPGADPFGVFGGGPGAFPSGASVAPSVAPSVQGHSAMGAPPSVYPGGSTVVPPQPSPPRASAAPSVQGDDPWADMGFGSAPAAAPHSPQRAPAPTGPVPGEDDDLFNAGLQPTRDEDKGAQQRPKEPKRESKKGKKGELPPGGEWYDAKIFTPTLGVMFFKPKELVDSLFLQTDKRLVDQLEDRPVVAFIVEGSSARSAGVELGHVLLKVNGIDVKNPKEASRLIKEGPRPLPLLFYVPETGVVVAEGEHMVKYNTKETGAPNSAKDWKPKYVVIGGIIAQPWMMNMYRSKSEYDIAVIETQARRPVSVKVKQFSLQGARVQNDWQGPQMVKYKNKLHPWKYIVVLPISRNPIKIASPNLSQLKPVHEGIRRVLQAQQRDRGGGGGGRQSQQRGPTSGDPHHGGGGQRGGGGGGYDTRNHPQNGGNTSPGAYYGGRPGGDPNRH